MSTGCPGAAEVWLSRDVRAGALMWTTAAPALAHAVGADDFIVKPFDPAVLLDKVRALLSRRG